VTKPPRLLLLLAAALSTAPLALAQGGRSWVFFTPRDDALPGEGACDQHRAARLRRARPLGPARIEADLPLDASRVAAIERCGASVHRRSRWLNAVSVWADPEQRGAIAALPFVESVCPVGRWRAPEVSPPLVLYGAQEAGATDFAEPLELLGVPAAEQRGLDGAAIRVAVFDTGFDPTHPALAHLPIVAQRDFINDDDDTGFEETALESCEGSPGCDPRHRQLQHGTAVLSLIGGIDPVSGDRIGPAPGVELLLAKTENNFSETRVEEDNWVAAMEWADSLGADLISSSLGYLSFDDGIGDYDPATDLDGRTTVVARAAIVAARQGILLCTAAGNEGPAPGSLVSPADADSILGAGAVDLGGATASFSSHGPTSDGRIKPDLMAPGVGLQAASYNHEQGLDYLSFSGTSAATPLIAGAAALVLQARPTLSAHELRAVLLESSDRASRIGADPQQDNARGWGIPDLCKALSSMSEGSDSEAPDLLALRVFPQPSRDAVQLAIDLPFDSRVQARIFDAAGVPVRTLEPVDMSAGRGVSSCELRWDGRNDRGARTAGGMYFVVVQTPDGIARAPIARRR